MLRENKVNRRYTSLLIEITTPKEPIIIKLYTKSIISKQAVPPTPQIKLTVHELSISVNTCRRLT